MKSVFAAIVIALMATSASAQQNCGEYSQLKEKYTSVGAERLFSGLVDKQTHVIEIWVKDGAGWVFIVVSPNGQACILDNGEHYIGLPPNT